MPRHLLPLALACAALSLFASSCSNGGGQSTPRIQIGASGGRIFATDGPLNGSGVEVPPGAVEGPTSFELAPIDAPRLPLDLAASGPAIQFGPLGIEFSRNVLAVIRMPELDPTGLSLAPVSVWVWQDDPLEGTLVQFAALRSGPRRGELLLERTARMVPVIAQPAPLLPLPEALGPLSGVRVQFDDGVTHTANITNEEPNLDGVSVARCDFDGFGYYWSVDVDGRLLEHGTYGIVADFQRINLQPVPRTSSAVFSGSEFAGRRSWELFDRYGGTQPNSWGEDETVTRFRYRRRFETPLGTFREVVEMEFLEPDVFGVDRVMARFQLAAGIGVIGYEFPPQNVAGRIASGEIDGVAIRAR